MELTAVPAREIDIDGELHVTGVCCGDDALMGYRCAVCRGTVHQQTIYGGIADRCEKCDADAWDPFGTHGTDKDGIVDPKERLEAIHWCGEDGIVHLAWVGRWRIALGCALSPFPQPVPVEEPFPTCLDCVVNDVARVRFRPCGA